MWKETEIVGQWRRFTQSSLGTFSSCRSENLRSWLDESSAPLNDNQKTCLLHLILMTRQWSSCTATDKNEGANGSGKRAVFSFSRGSYGTIRLLGATGWCLVQRGGNKLGIGCIFKVPGRKPGRDVSAWHQPRVQNIIGQSACPSTAQPAGCGRSSSELLPFI